MSLMNLINRVAGIRDKDTRKLSTYTEELSKQSNSLVQEVERTKKLSENMLKVMGSNRDRREEGYKSLARSVNQVLECLKFLDSINSGINPNNIGMWYQAYTHYQSVLIQLLAEFTFSEKGNWERERWNYELKLEGVPSVLETIDSLSSVDT